MAVQLGAPALLRVSSCFGSRGQAILEAVGECVIAKALPGGIQRAAQRYVLCGTSEVRREPLPRAIWH